MGQRFDLGDVLSITTERLVSRDHIDGVYRILNYMTGDELFTHQLPRASDECKPELLRQHPDLVEIVFPDGLHGEADIYAWLDALVETYGANREVEPMSADDHTHIDPLEELGLLGVPADRVVPIVLSDEES